MRFRTVLLVLGTLVFLAACSSPHEVAEAPSPIPRLNPATLPPGEAEAEAVQEGSGAVPTPAGPGEAGKAVFDVQCLVCHNLTAEAKVGPGLAGMFDQDSLPNGEAFSEEALRVWIINGGGAMPGVPLEADDLDSLIDYLREATAQ